jgi:RNA polymerase sigma-70 factor (ECF subfamily)
VTANDNVRDGRDDRAAFRAAYNAYQPGLARFVTRRVGDPHVAEEICQETWFGYFRRFEEYRRYDSPAAPLFVIASHKICDWWRKQPPPAADAGETTLVGDRTASRLEKISLGLFARAGVDLATQVAIRVDVARAVARLTPRQQQAVELHLVDDLDQATVAALMGISVRAVKALIARATVLLRHTSILAGYEGRPAMHREVRK